MEIEGVRKLFDYPVCTTVFQRTKRKEIKASSDSLTKVFNNEYYALIRKIVTFATYVSVNVVAEKKKIIGLDSERFHFKCSLFL